MLTDTQCRAARPRGRAYTLTDGSGLVLEIKLKGVKAWRWRYRFNLTTGRVTKESRFAIATTP